MTARRLDETDEKLLAILRKDARKPVVALAKAVGLSRTAVQGRMARLEDEGTIRGYTVELGRAAEGAAVKAFLVMRIESRPCATVIRRFSEWPEIIGCWSVAGPDVDAIVLANMSTTEELGDLRARLAAVPGVASVTTAPILATIFERIAS